MTDTVRALTCPQCGGTIALRAAGVSVTLVCEHCGSTLDAAREDVKVLTAAAQAMRRPEIPVGTRGVLDGTQWEVVGYLERADEWVSWCEYLLFNPYLGYAFLVDDGRRFSLGRLTDRVPEPAWNGLAYDGRRFARFGDPYGVRVTFVVGEFYWRVTVGETVTATDYARSGAMLSCEENGSERTWTLLEMLERGVAERAFGIPPRRIAWGATPTPAPHEPSPYLRLLREALAIAAVATVALIVLATGGAGARQVLSATIDAPFGGATRSVVVGTVVLPAAYNRVTIRVDAGTLDNAWVDLDYSLVDRRTQESFDTYATAEHYSGSDSDGPWTEGDRSPDVSLASIPAGSYDLLVEAKAQRWTDPAATVTTAWWAASPVGTGGAPVTIAVAVGGGFPGNAVLAILAIALWPAMLVALHVNFEKRRRAPLEA